jgi:hypothetical protein
MIATTRPRKSNTLEETEQIIRRSNTISKPQKLQSNAGLCYGYVALVSPTARTLHLLTQPTLSSSYKQLLLATPSSSAKENYQPKYTQFYPPFPPSCRECDDHPSIPPQTVSKHKSSTVLASSLPRNIRKIHNARLKKTQLVSSITVPCRLCLRRISYCWSVISVTRLNLDGELDDRASRPQVEELDRCCVTRSHLLDSGNKVAEHARNEEASHQVAGEAQTTC